MNRKNIIRKPEGGFTLIELLVVVLIIGILAAIAVPQYFKVVEKGKAAEALAQIDDIRGAQERYLAKAGNYCAGSFAACTGWDMTVPTLKYFTSPTSAAAGTGTAPNWSMTIVRNGTPAVYGAYTISYNVGGGTPPTFGCSSTDCTADLIPN